VEVEPRVGPEGIHPVSGTSHGTGHTQGNKICEPVKGINSGFKDVPYTVQYQ